MVEGESRDQQAIKKRKVDECQHSPSLEHADSKVNHISNDVGGMVSAAVDKLADEGEHDIKCSAESRRELQIHDAGQRCRELKYLRNGYNTDIFYFSECSTCGNSTVKERSRSCPAPSELLDDGIELTSSMYTVGSLVWGKYKEYPWWPGMVTTDPKYETFVFCRDGIPEKYHVTLFNMAPVNRYWIKTSRLRSFSLNNVESGLNANENNIKKLRKSLEMAERPGLKESVAMATQCLKENLTLESRIRMYGFTSCTDGNAGLVDSSVTGNRPRKNENLKHKKNDSLSISPAGDSVHTKNDAKHKDIPTVGSPALRNAEQLKHKSFRSTVSTPGCLETKIDSSTTQRRQSSHSPEHAESNQERKGRKQSRSLSNSEIEDCVFMERQSTLYIAKCTECGKPREENYKQKEVNAIPRKLGSSIENELPTCLPKQTSYLHHKNTSDKQKISTAKGSDRSKDKATRSLKHVKLGKEEAKQELPTTHEGLKLSREPITTSQSKYLVCDNHHRKNHEKLKILRTSSPRKTELKRSEAKQVKPNISFNGETSRTKADKMNRSTLQSSERIEHGKPGITVKRQQRKEMKTKSKQIIDEDRSTLLECTLTEPVEPTCGDCSGSAIKVEDKEQNTDGVYTVGSLVWAKMEDYTWWPGMVDTDPDKNDFVFSPHNNNTLTKYHITFFDPEPVSRRWINTSRVKPFNLENLESEFNVHEKNIKRQRKSAEMTERQRFKESFEMAKRCLKENLTPERRIQVYGFQARYEGGIKRSRDRARTKKRHRENGNSAHKWYDSGSPVLSPKGVNGKAIPLMELSPHVNTKPAKYRSTERSESKTNSAISQERRSSYLPIHAGDQQNRKESRSLSTSEMETDLFMEKQSTLPVTKCTNCLRSSEAKYKSTEMGAGEREMGNKAPTPLTMQTAHLECRRNSYTQDGSTNPGSHEFTAQPITSTLTKDSKHEKLEKKKSSTSSPLKKEKNKPETKQSKQNEPAVDKTNRSNNSENRPPEQIENVKHIMDTNDQERKEVMKNPRQMEDAVPGDNSSANDKVTLLTCTTSTQTEPGKLTTDRFSCTCSTSLAIQVGEG